MAQNQPLPAAARPRKVDGGGVGLAVEAQQRGELVRRVLPRVERRGLVLTRDALAERAQQRVGQIAAREKAEHALVRRQEAAQKALAGGRGQQQRLETRERLLTVRVGDGQPGPVRGENVARRLERRPRLPPEMEEDPAEHRTPRRREGKPEAELRELAEREVAPHRREAHLLPALHRERRLAEDVPPQNGVRVRRGLLRRGLAQKGENRFVRAAAARPNERRRGGVREPVDPVHGLPPFCFALSPAGRRRGCRTGTSGVRPARRCRCGTRPRSTRRAQTGI